MTRPCKSAAYVLTFAAFGINDTSIASTLARGTGRRTLMGSPDRFSRTARGRDADVTRAFDAYVDDLSNWYIRRSRRRFWDGDPAALATLHEALRDIRRALLEADGFTVVGEAADAVSGRVVDARRVALDADLQTFGEVEDHLVLDAELTCQLVNPDLLGGQNAVRFLARSVT